ncbi:thermonuclease family protein [Hutsoniella sourekii]
MLKKVLNYLLLLVLVAGMALGSPMVQGQVNTGDFPFSLLADGSQLDPEKTFVVKDWKVIDGDTADFILDRQQEPSIKSRFLLIDTPELRGNIAYAKEAKARVEELFKQADVIRVEYEGKEKDKYGRDLVHVWVDDLLLSEILVSEGYAIARYIKNYIPDSKYASLIYESQDYAKAQGKNVWKDGDFDYLVKAEESTTTTARSNQSVDRRGNLVTADPIEEASSTSTPAEEEEEIIQPTPFLAEVEPEPVPEPAPNVYYQNCDDVRAHGAAPIYPGDPGWDPKFDRDNDGIGCEI